MIIDRLLKIRKSNNPGDENRLRSFVKAMSWRAVGTLDTILLSWIITGKITVALSIGMLELITKTLLYYFHERAWNIVKWGK
jgi:uncharacterized membrane protein